MSRDARDQGVSDGVVARGKIKVDARRAVEKLREHLLVDLHLYTLEIARAAVLGGAKQIDVENDADDVKITFDGEGLDEATLTRLLDHVLVEAVTRDARRKRLLATGVNAALGLSPAYVDILTPADPKAESGAKGAAAKSAQGGRTCLRVRWTPELLAPKDKDAPAKSPNVERVPAPKGMPETGVRIEIKRRLGWNVVRQAIAGGMIAEVVHLSAATHEIAVGMTLAGKPFPRPARAAALVRAPFTVRGVTRAVVEIIEPMMTHPEIELLEHGVCLTRYAWTFGAGFPSEGLGLVTLPVRVIVDADELPTNASRSEIQKDAPLLGLVAQAAQHAFDDAVATLLATVTGKGEAAPGTEILTQNKEALEDALGALACLALKAMKGGLMLPEKTRPLLDAFLLRDGLGRAMAPAELLGRAPSRVYVWRGEEPLSKDLEPWTGDVVWLRGRVAERVYELYDTADAQQIVEQAKVGAARRRALLAHAASEPTVPPQEGELIRTSFEEKSGEFSGIRGQVAICAESAERPGSVFRIFVDGRALDTINIDAETIPLRLEVAVSWEGRIRARYGYDGVERDHSLKLAIFFATRAAVLAADRNASSLKGRASDTDVAAALRAALRAAIATHLVSAKRIGLEKPPSDIPLTLLRGLHGAAIWPTTEPRRWESLRSIEAAIAKTGVICVAKPESTGVAVDGRPVIAAKEREMGWITAALEPKATLAPYARWLVTPAAFAQREEHQLALLKATLDDEVYEKSCVMDVRRPGIRGIAAVAPASKLVLFHAGKRVVSPPIKASLGPFVLVVDDDSVVPGDLPTAPRPPLIEAAIPAIERQLCETIIAATEEALARSPEPAPGTFPLSTLLRSYFLDCASELKPRAQVSGKIEDKALLDRIRALPLLVTLDEKGSPVLTSIAMIERAHPPSKSIPYLAEAPGFETLTWQPILITRNDPVWPAFERWTAGRAVRGEPELSARSEQAILASRRRVILAKPQLSLESVGDLAEPSTRVVQISSKTHTLPPGLVIAAALPNSYVTLPVAGPLGDLVRGIALEHALIDVLFMDRLVCRYALTELRIPVVARVSFADERNFVAWEHLSDAGISTAKTYVRMAALALAIDFIHAASGPSKGDAIISDLRALRLMLALVTGPTADPAIIDRLRLPELLWPTVQGDWLPLDAMRRVAGEGIAELCVGNTRHVPWLGPARGKADLDEPILYLPATAEGATAQAILTETGIKCRSVTDALAKLQARRAASRPNEAPALVGAPPHPELRMSLTEAGVQSADGELELIEGPMPDVRVIGLDGTSISVTEGAPFPIRVVARVESVDLRPEMMKGLMKEIARGAVRRALSLSQKLDELPTFVRDHVRAIVCKSVNNESKVAARQRSAPIFYEISGKWLSLNDLQLDPGATINYTNDPPPYPKRRPADPVVRLSKDEASALQRIGKLRDMTANLRRDRAAEERSTAPPVASISIPPELRSKCMRIIPVSEGRLTGEIGVLAPQHQDARGINLFVTGRPLCLIDDGPGWGLCAAVNNDSIKPNRWFDGVKSASSIGDIQRVVRDIATRVMRASIAVPPDALAVKWFDSVEVTGDEKPVRLFGALWLPSTWPLEPTVRGMREYGSEPTRQPVIAAGPAMYLRRHVPVCGDLIAASDVTWASIERTALREAEAMISELAPPHAAPQVEAAYRWNMALLGFTSIRVPPARGSDGADVSMVSIVGELATKGSIWITRREGTADGAFPGKPPAFILLDGPENAALLNVLKHRAMPGAVRELGALETHEAQEKEPASPQSAAAAPSQDASKPLYFRDLLEGNSDVVASLVKGASTGAPLARPQPELPWLERLRRRVALLFASTEARPDTRLKEQSALAAALHQALGELGLVGGPVYEIVEAKRGPAVRYDERNKRVFLNRRHRSLAWLTSSEAPSPRAMSFLIAAIVSEINRALTGVTDAEERRVLLQLLRTGLDLPESGST